MQTEKEWTEYRRISEALDRIEEQVTGLRIDVAILKTKAALFGAAGGLVISILFRLLAGK